MGPTHLRLAFVLRVLVDQRGERLVLQNLSDGEAKEFSTWRDLIGYVQSLPKLRTLK